MSSHNGEVENVIEAIVKQLNMSREEARRLLHRYVCIGLCGWYEREAEKTGFAALKLTEEQFKIVEDSVQKLVSGLSMEERMKKVHVYLCPRGPCSKWNENVTPKNHSAFSIMDMDFPQTPFPSFKFNMDQFLIVHGCFRNQLHVVL
ncbi:hypothetical protein KEJ27_07285 [Candidatus Bathyarchaeota archaeon]|nr:hypothetical protein [Candidatus Bathyarchaeota archaeon]MBS7613219.1 hypothetical protein [Candidatus Bathyarchaeota archaeon]MBS7617259.1 hypothetical protein [Candidatus Bathyarchaeota archaeon]